MYNIRILGHKGREMEKHIFSHKIAPLGVALAISAGLFYPLAAHAENASIGLRKGANWDGTNYKVGYDIDENDGADVFAQIQSETGTAIELTENTNDFVITTDIDGFKIRIENENKIPYRIRLNGDIVQTEASPQNTSDTFQISNFINEKTAPYIFEIEADDGPSGGDPEQSNFNGSIWFTWKKANGDLGKYKITDIEPAHMVNGYLSYVTKMVKASDIPGFNMNEINTNADGEDYAFLYDNDENQHLLSTQDKWSGLKNVLDNLNDEELHSTSPDPTGAKNGKNSISTNGDRGFRLTIYNENNYFGIVNATSPEDLEYYPDFWNADFHNPELDISGTTAEKPAILNSYLLEDTIKLKDTSGNDIPADDIAIVDNTPIEAVTITNGKIKFNSNYYDQVLLSIKGEYYLLVTRIVVNSEGHVYVPATDTNEYEVYAHYTLKNGSKVSLKLERAAASDRDGGKNLKVRAYKISNSDSDKVSFVGGPTNAKFPTEVIYTIVKSGSSTTNFAGTLAGHGKGTGYIFSEGGYKIKIRGNE